jgi:ABC-2 type transport system ATP-binding protein
LGGGPGGISLLADKTPQLVQEKQAIVEAKHLVKKFGTFVAADDITFSVPQGEIFGFLGPNGAGKSTTFKMLCGLLKPTSGESYVEGYNLQTAPAEGRARIGYMAQKFSLYGNISVLQNLQFFAGIYNLKGKHKQEMIDQMIEVFNFKSHLNETADILPLGFKQRLALSCAVMHPHPVSIRSPGANSGHTSMA